MSSSQLARTVAARIEQARVDAGWSYRRLSEASGVSKSNLQRLLTGGQDMTVSQLEALCDALELDVTTVVAVSS